MRSYSWVRGLATVYYMLHGSTLFFLKKKLLAYENDFLVIVIQYFHIPCGPHVQQQVGLYVPSWQSELP